uniref:Late embryogenesis abundant protein LEA-2 subgroup domain-containing protein n=1 Tax=Davidia involucrata TaxID=16924 RepID=A0A5B7C2P1_DAVIN
MADRKEQVKPLAPAASRISIDDDHEALDFELKKYRHRKYIKCCGCITALMLIQAVVILILIFTIFRVKDPAMKMSSVSFQGFDVFNEATRRPAANMTLTAALSVKNPNVASFKFRNATTTLNYGGEKVAEARNPPGLAKARRTLQMNVTLDIMLDKMMAVPSLTSDLRLGLLNLSSYTRIRGRVKILKIIKKHVVVKMNCTMTVNIRSRSIQDQKCKRKVSL